MPDVGKKWVQLEESRVEIDKDNKMNKIEAGKP